MPRALQGKVLLGFRQVDPADAADCPVSFVHQVVFATCPYNV